MILTYDIGALFPEDELTHFNTAAFSQALQETIEEAEIQVSKDPFADAILIFRGFLIATVRKGVESETEVLMMKRVARM